MKHYKYIGTVAVEIQGIGKIKANDIVVADDINHPLFKLVDPKTGKEIKK